ncbi:ABC transporter ATP-binding protein [Prosthecobacter sp.]|jgi:lipopolysaccharide transport system ATP-binding protein
MSGPVIQVENISKLYRLGEVSTGTLSHDLNRWWHRFRGKEDPYAKLGQVNDRARKAENEQSMARHEYVYALKHINFSVKQGEVLGIIGRNGAGKSTLLKILSRVTAPSSGSIKVKGRVASLLEVGTGFHPELSGRENIYLNGAILGMRRSEITRQLDEIVDFSGCAAYIDTPVKRYSSGMYVRLAFAVAAHLEPEILVVDEVLAVGDTEFQKKCLGKMQSVAVAGRTVLFVSHNLAALRTLCHSGLVLADGMVVGAGEANQMVNLYLRQNSHCVPEISWDDPSAAPQDELFRLIKVRVASAGAEPDILRIDQDIHIDVEFELRESHSSVSTSLHIMTQGVCAFAAVNDGLALSAGIHRARYVLPGQLLNTNHYSVNVFLITNGTQLRVIQQDILAFETTEPSRDCQYQGLIIGTVRPTIPVKITTLVSQPVSNS